MSTPDNIYRLVETFERNLHTYKISDYNETQVRREFIDPFFTELGWDVTNKEGYAEAYKDVVHEYSLKTSDSVEAPDYCFRIGGTRKFFVEAKKPKVDIKDDIHPAYQLKRYAWSAKLPLSILTDFEDLAIYDCRTQPKKNDKPSTGRIKLYNYKDYITNWEEIADVFSKEAVLKGSFDKYAETNKGKKGTAEVDDSFLKEIESWRKTIAMNIALRNTNLNVRELNYAVQKIIDRIIFLRICEDRGLEEYGQLMALQNGANVYPRLKQIFIRADEKYNSGLFHFYNEKDRYEFPDEITTGLNIDDKVLKDIIKNLYYPDSPYEFSVLPSDILGHVYEQFLGKVIRLTAGHHAVVEDKPEVKKAGGVYYTPTYIVEYIVNNTLGKLLENDKDKLEPKQVSKIKVLDPACGSGSFLLGAYQYLLDWHLKYYINPNQSHASIKPKDFPIYQSANGEWRLTTKEKKRILLNNIFGVDIDSQAVEVTKLSLLLKVLEGESDETIVNQFKMFRERALPDLGSNIKCGNSLIGPDFYDEMELNFLDDEEKLRINVFNWNKEFKDIMDKGGFDVVIGNPPYDVLEKDRNMSSWPHNALVDYVRRYNNYEDSLGGKLNLFRFFIIKSLMLLKQDGAFGMILPLALLADISCKNTRENLLKSCKEILSDCFPQKDNPNKRIFKNAKLSTCIITCNKSLLNKNLEPKIKLRIYPFNDFADNVRESVLLLSEIKLLDPDNIPIPLVSSIQWEIVRSIYQNSKISRLGEMKDFVINRGEINQTNYRKYISDNEKLQRLIKGVEIGRYRINKKLSQGKREWFDEKSFLSENNPKEIILKERIATQRITGVDEKERIVANIVGKHTYFADSTNSIYLSNGSHYTLYYLLALLNSNLFQWRFKLTSTNNNVGTNELQSMPFRKIYFNSDDDRIYFENMNLLVGNMIELNSKLELSKTPLERESIQRQIDATDSQIDRLVYQLYELTEEEIKIVENS